MTTLRTYRRRMIMATASLFLLAGCGSSVASPDETRSGGLQGPGASETGDDRGGRQPIEIWYAFGVPGEGSYRFRVVTDGTRVRVSIGIGYGGVTEKMLYVWDGSQVMEFSNSNATPYTVYEAPQEHRDILQMVTTWGDRRFDTSGCVSLGTTTIIGRTAVSWRCPTTPSSRARPGPQLVWLDQATGIVLKSQLFKSTFMVAQKLDLDPEIDATTFSTRPPANVEVDVVAAKNPPPGQTRRAPDFTLQLVDGGRIGLQDLTGAPFVLAFFSSDLYFDPNGEDCPRCLDALLSLQAQTSHETQPRVLGVQVGDRGKPGLPFVPRGITLPLAHEQTPLVKHSFGLTGMVGIVFVDSNGTIAASYNRAPTTKQITDSLQAIQ